MAGLALYLYSASEIETALGLESRAVAMLDKLGLAPAAVTGGGRGRERLFDATGLAQLSIAAALYWGGVEVVPAAKLAGAVLSDFIAVYGRAPSMLYQNSRKWWDVIEEIRRSPEYAGLDRTDRTDDSVIYAAMRRSDASYKPIVSRDVV